jgi:DNA invertase Pin-like site-specific DNA recombinase
MSRSEIKRKVRCAIYSRKSSEEGLELAFNSLDAQREACASYIDSQRHEGWVAQDDRYDDGGYSGGTLERPALQRLLRDIEAGRVDTVVCYKIDRLSRSLTDFAKLVDVFDRNRVTFVSVTQSFCTTTSASARLWRDYLTHGADEKRMHWFVAYSIGARGHSGHLVCSEW